MFFYYNWEKWCAIKYFCVEVSHVVKVFRKLFVMGKPEEAYLVL